MKITHQLFRTLLLAAAAAAATAPALLRADGHFDVGLSVGIPLPHGYVDVVVGREHYYSYRGSFYRRGPHGRLVIVGAPIGARVRELPPRCARVYVGHRVYYRYGDVFYEPVDHGYVVVEGPREVHLPPPPPPGSEYLSVWANGGELLFKDGQFFQRTPEGLVWTEPPIGAVAKSLPGDATSVWVQDNEYFESDNIYFRKTPDGYRVVPSPFPQPAGAVPPPPPPPASHP